MEAVFAWDGDALTKRASRTGPSGVMNGGTTLVAPSSVASATWGFGTGFCGLFNPGLDPPIAGCAWQSEQLLPLNVGPRPVPGSPGMVPDTDATSLKISSALAKLACSAAFRVA